MSEWVSELVSGWARGSGGPVGLVGFVGVSNFKGSYMPRCPFLEHPLDPITCQLNGPSVSRFGIFQFVRIFFEQQIM